jgi:hypothetical protein
MLSDHHVPGGQSVEAWAPPPPEYTPRELVESRGRLAGTQPVSFGRVTKTGPVVQQTRGVREGVLCFAKHFESRRQLFLFISSFFLFFPCPWRYWAVGAAYHVENFTMYLFIRVVVVLCTGEDI